MLIDLFYNVNCRISFHSFKQIELTDIWQFLQDRIDRQSIHTYLWTEKLLPTSYRTYQSQSTLIHLSPFIVQPIILHLLYI